jgi:hypothetical protein
MTLSAAPSARTQASEPSVKQTAQHNFAIGYLRAFITVLVLAHHAVLAYHPYAPAPVKSLLAQPRSWGAFPVVDIQRWTPFSFFVSFNDIFFMALMFFLSGLFVWQSLQRKGSGGFLGDRAKRLGIPFVVTAVFLAPLAYYPTYLQTGATGIAGFLHQWRLLGSWPVGPAWFIWLLLAFDCVAALLFALTPKWGEALGRISSTASRRPFIFFGSLVVVSASAYIPMELIFNGFSWASFGPFFFQTSRLLLYAVYFLAGIGVGAYGIERGLLASGGKLARCWFRWIPASLLTFAATVVLFIATFAVHNAPRFWEGLSDFAFVTCAAATSFAFLALFLRFVAKQKSIFDSLSANAYGMYLIHYIFISWLQYAFLQSHLHPAAKGSIVFIGTLLLSWTITAAIRRIPFVGKVV